MNLWAYRAWRREDYERAIKERVDEIGRLREMLDKERDRNTALTIELVKLHQVVSTPPPTPNEQERKDWASIELVLDQLGLQGAPRRQQIDWAERMLRQGVKAAEVVQQIRQGGDDDF